MAFFVRRNEPETVDESTERTERVRNPWMAVAAVLGAVFLAFGVYAMTRTGLDTDHLFSPRERVLGFEHTPALGLGEAVFGVLMLMAVLSRLFGRVQMALLGAAMLGFGVVVVVDAWAGRVDQWTGAGERHGWVFVAAGAIAFLAATAMPTVRHRTVVREREVRQVDTSEPVDRQPAEPVETAPRRHWWQPHREAA